MASNCHIGSLFFISGSKVAAVFPRGLFDEKSNISPPLIWLRVPMAKFVFVCVCIVFYLCISCLSMCNCICIWSVFVWFHHQASPAAHSPPLLTSRHLPAKLTAVRWQFASLSLGAGIRKIGFLIPVVPDWGRGKKQRGEIWFHHVVNLLAWRGNWACVDLSHTSLFKPVPQIWSLQSPLSLILSPWVF